MTDAHFLPGVAIRIGRQPDNDLALTGDLNVSRHHAELRRHPDGSFELADLGSHGGTFVNGKRITRTVLTERDIVGIGHGTFRLSDGKLRPCRPSDPAPAGKESPPVTACPAPFIIVGQIPPDSGSFGPR